VLLVVAATEPELRGADGAETLVCGIGPVESACAVTAALAARKPDALLHVGIAGCRLRSRLEPGALVIGSESVYEDADGRLVPARVEPAPELVARARGALPAAHVLPIGTSARVGGTSSCDVEAMEGFGVLRAAALAGVPALELRAIANRIEEPDRARWLIDEALDALAAGLAALIPALG
jgi:futalosine hydrolase